MSKMKIYNGSAWVGVDGNICDTVDNIHFRTVNSMLQYSSDNITWNDVGMSDSAVVSIAASTPISIGTAVDINSSWATPSGTSGLIKGVALTNAVTKQEVQVCIDGIARISSGGLTSGHIYYALSSGILTDTVTTSDRIGVALSSTELLLIIPSRLRVL